MWDELIHRPRIHVVLAAQVRVTSGAVHHHPAWPSFYPLNRLQYPYDLICFILRSMKKTTFIWVILVILGISVVLEIFGAVTLAISQNLSAYYGNHLILNVLAATLLAADVVLTVLFSTKLWTLKNDVLRWTNMYFCWSVFRSIFAIIADILSNKGTQFGNAVELAVILALWPLLYRHLKTVVSSKNAPSNGLTSKKALLLFGGIILAVLAFYAAHTAYVMSTTDGPALDKESKEWVDTVAPQILESWDPDVMLKNASPEWLQFDSESGTKNETDALRNEYGTLTKYGTSTGEAGIHVTNFTTTITAEYVVEADFTKGHARVFIKGIKHGSDWQLFSLHVDSDPNLRWQNEQLTDQPPLQNPGDSQNVNGLLYGSAVSPGN
jgi:hypothetical protein